MSKRRFEMIEGTSSKFWEISRAGAEVTTTYGKIGSAGQTTVKDEGSIEAGTKLVDRLVREKTKKGYVEVATTAAPVESLDDGAAQDEEDPSGDGVVARILGGVDALGEDEKRDLAYELGERARFSDPSRAVQAFRWALDHRLETDDVDGDTVTSLLIRMIELTPDDDALLLEYLREVSDSGYASTSRTLKDLVGAKSLSPDRAKRFALASTFVEGWCLEVSRTEPPADWVQASLQRSFALAAKHGATERDWKEMRAELVSKHIGSESRPAKGEHARWTS